MISPIDNLAKINQNISLKKSTDVTQTSSSDVIGGAVDRLDISGDSGLDLLRAEAVALGNELPGLIAQAILKPVSDGLSQDPLNRVLFSLVNPAKSILGVGIQNFSKERLSALQGEVEKLRLEMPRLLSNVLLAPFTKNGSQSNSLNGIVESISRELIGLADLIQQKLR